MRYTLIITTPLVPLLKLPAGPATGLAWENQTAISVNGTIQALHVLAARRQQPIPTVPFPLRNVVRGAENLTWLNRGTLDNPPNRLFRPGPRQYPLAFFPLDNMYSSITPQRYAIEIRDKDFNLKDRLENAATAVQWEWNRVGGCGRCTMVIQGDYLRVAVAADDDIRIYLPNSTTGATLWYRGYVESVIPQLSGGTKGSIRIECAGYFNWLDRVLVNDSGGVKTYTAQEISLIVTSIINTFIVGTAPVALGTVDASTFIPDTLEFKVSAKEALRTLYELLGSVEYGVDANLNFFWRTESTELVEKFFLGGNVTNLQDRIDFKNIVNKIYFEGGDVAGTTFVPIAATAQDSIDRYGLHEEVLSNGSIVTNAVASQYMSAVLIQRAKPFRQMSVTLKNITRRFEASLPMGLISVVDIDVAQARFLWGKTANGGANKIWGTSGNGGSNTLYGGVRKEQVDRVTYTLSPEDGRVDAEVQFGSSVAFSKASATIKKLELVLNTLRQRSL